MAQSKALGNVFKLHDIVNVKDPAYGAKGDGVTDDTAAFTAWTTAINALGGGVGVIPPSIYNVAPSISGTLCDFSGLEGIAILADGATINDTNTYTGTQSATLFKFTDCDNILVRARVSSQVAVTTSAQNVRGLIAITLLQGCTNVDVDLHLTGGLYGMKVNKASGDAASYSSRNIRANIYATGTYYPYTGEFAGDNTNIQLEADTCGRNFFICGNKNNTIKVRSKNQQVTSLIKAYEGYGCDNVRVDYFDRESDDCSTSAPVISLEYGDSTAATHRNIELRVNLKNPTTNSWGNAIGWAKYVSDGGGGDTTGRGHVLDGFKISGIIDNTSVAVNHLNMEAGAFASADVQRNIVVGNLTLLGTGSAFSMQLPTLSGPATFTNVFSQHNIYAHNSANGQVVFKNCEALNFTADTAHTDTHVYDDCNITEGSSQNLADNKTFRNTKFVGGKKNGTRVQTAEKFLSGDLTGTNNIFKIGMNAAALGARLRLKYYLVADFADLDPVTRDETYGVKNFSLTMNAAGDTTIVEAVTDEVTEKSTGTASAMTVTAVDGDATGGHVAVACTNYSGSTANGIFELEMLSNQPRATLQAT